MDPGREFLLKRGYAPKLRSKIAKGRRAVMPGVAMDDSAGVMSPLKQIIHDAAQQAGGGPPDHRI